MMIPTFTLGSERALSDTLEGVVLNIFSDYKPPDHQLSPPPFPQESLVISVVKACMPPIPRN